MRTCIRPAEGDARGSLREESYETELGVGRLLLAGDLPLGLELPDPHRRAAPAAGPRSRWAADLERYFAGEPLVFALDVDAYAKACGLTAFERDVYAALAAVPRGEVVSYGELAALAGHPRAHRAAGSVMARNELPVILPCHRVVRSDGSLGYYGDDPAWKARLLELEGVELDGARLALARECGGAASGAPASDHKQSARGEQ